HDGIFGDILPGPGSEFVREPFSRVEASWPSRQVIMSTAIKDRPVHTKVVKRSSAKERSIGLLTATLMTAAMIVGTGLFSSLGGATAKAGSGILLSMMMGGLVALC